MTVADLRQKYHSFSYKRASFQLSPQGLEIHFQFETAPDLVFNPSLVIPGVTQEHLDRLPSGRLEAYAFHLGLVEMLSYWKTTCSPEIKIEAGALSPDQLAWWQNLLLQGLGEFFYVNHIDFTTPDFVTWHCPTPDPTTTAPLAGTVLIPEKLESLLIPVGGGKDSAVTLELVQQSAPGLPQRLATVRINPTLAATTLSQLSGITEQLLVERRLDPKIFELNQQGFLNGHTPFSAMAAFTTVMVAEIFNLAGVAVSNERSANEGNARFNNVEINHQYSKTFAFEQSFQKYCQSYFPGSPFYFSFMRPLYELQIAKLFAQLTTSDKKQQIRSAFRSCNRGQRSNSWCGACSKCLFAYTILSPFISQAELETMFSKNLFTDLSLWPIALELIGKGENKPFECVGTYEESLIAFYLSTQKIQADYPSVQLPELLAKIQSQILTHESKLDSRAQTLLQSWNSEHGLPVHLANHLKNVTL